MDTDTLITVIMSVYNEKELWLEESISSILNQTYSNLEFIIIIDNPTNINLINVVASFAKKDIRVKYLINEPLANSTPNQARILTF